MPESSQDLSYRLPRSVVPERYEITLAPDLRAFTFTGEQRVAVQVTEPVTEVVLNATELEIHEAALVDATGDRVPASVTYDEASERALLALEYAVQPGPATLELRFTGTLNDKLSGFYRSTYRDASGQEKVLACTQFESTDARKAFPCWDEPDLKAVFKIALVVDAHLAAISNAAVVAETPLPDGKKRVEFAETMKMATYLVACVVGELDATETVDVDGTPLRVIFVPGKRKLADFGLEIGAFTLRFFSSYYGIPYPGGKLDLLAIPDFAAGAMENLGCVTFRETALLVDLETASRAELERVADVVAHEIAHMWFGDLVTMQWWNGLWLNEAFATFMEMLAVDAFRPRWERWTSFAVSRAAAMQTDGLNSTRSIEFPVRLPEEAAGMFDILTYEKGGAVLRMLEQYLGPEVFRQGISHYLTKHAYANAETTDLWDAIEETSGQPTRRIMDSWIFQPGHPLVSVERDGDALRLAQAPFRYLPPEQPLNLQWDVPVGLRMRTPNGDVEQKVLLEGPSASVNLPSGTEWIVANAGGHGFFRVRYDTELLQKLQPVLGELAPLERFGLVSDTWASVQAGRSPLADFLDLARLFRDETDRNVWTSLIGSLGYLNRIADPTDRPALQRYARELLEPAVSRLGWEPQEGESELEGQLRGTLIGALGTLAEDSAAQARAQELFVRWTTDRSAVDRNLVPAVVGIVAHIGGDTEYDDFVQRFKQAPTPQEEQRFLFSLASFQRRDLVQRTAGMTLDGQVRTQDAPYLLAALIQNLAGGDLAWEFVKTNWDTINARYPENTIPRMSQAVSVLCTPALEADVRAFFAAHPIKQAGKMLDQALERLRIMVAFKEREAGALHAYLVG